MRSGYDNSVTLSYRIQTNPAPPIQYWMKILWIWSEFKSKVGRVIICLQNLCDDYNVYKVYKCELSSVQVHLFIFSQWDMKTLKRNQYATYRGINDNLVEWCSCAFLTQRTCFCKIFRWCFLRPINVVTIYGMIFFDFYLVVVYNIIEKWMIYGNL